MKEVKNTKIIGLIIVIIVAVLAISANAKNNQVEQESQNNLNSNPPVEQQVPSVTPANEIEEIFVNTVTIEPPTKTPEPTRVGIEALNPDELERYDRLNLALKESLDDPKAKVDSSMHNRFNMYINTSLVSPDLSEEQLAAAKVFDEIMYFACKYGVMPDGDALNLNSSFSYLGGVNSRVPESVANCVMTREVLQKITESGWKIQITSFNNGDDLSNFFSRGFILDPERISLIEGGRPPRFDDSESLLLTEAQVGRILLGVGPDKDSILEFGNQMSPLAVNDSRLLPNVLIMKDDFMPFGGEVADNVWTVSFLPPGADPKNHGSGFAIAEYPESHFYYSASVITTYDDLK